MSVTFGIDLGIASCGWAVLRHPTGAQPGEVVALGSWMFDKPETPKEKTPTNQLRRGARLLRRVIRRRRGRMTALRQLFVKHRLLTSDDSDALKLKGLDPWDLRAKGLDKALTPAELAVALGHIAKRRGFKSSAKNKSATNAVSEDSKMLKALEATRERLGRYRTLGEMFARDPDYVARRRNRDGNFDRTAGRDELAAEVRTLFAAQRRLGNASVSEELEAAYVDAAFFQRPLQDSERLVGECTFEPGEKRAPRHAPSFERFRLLTRLINLRITTDEGERPLTAAELVAATADLGSSRKLTGTTVRKLIGLPAAHRFTALKPEHESGDIAAGKGEAMGGTYALRKALGEANWATLHERADQLDAIAHVLTFFETDEKIAKELRKLGLDQPVLDALDAGLATNAFARFNGAGHISTKAARTLNPLLAQGQRYDQACTAVGYDHAATKWGARPQVVDKAGFNALVKLMGEDVANPVARKAMTEGLKQLWAMRNEWGLPDAIHIEMARDVGNSLEKRNEIQRGLDKTSADRQRQRQEARELLGIEDVNGDTLLRYRLWKEQGGESVYSGRHIDPRLLIATDNSLQVDHILPWSRFGDDSFNNKTLCFAGENQLKRGATPFEWFGHKDDEWETFVRRVENARDMKGFKKRNYLLKNAEEAAEKFRTRNLNDTRYACRVLAEAARLFYPPGERQDKGGVRRVFTRPGGLIAALRQAWGVESLKKGPDGKRVEDARHHALDAAVVAAVSEAEVQKLTRSFQQWEQAGLGRPLRQVDEPWEGFRRQLVTMYNQTNPVLVFVARAERRRARGEGHAATIRQVVEQDGKEIVFERKSIDSITEADLARVKDGDRNWALVESVHAWIARNRPADARPSSPNKDQAADLATWRDAGRPKDAIPIVCGDAKIAKLNLLTKKNVAVRVRGGTADRGEMVRVDVFTKANRRGKDEFYLVPIYPHQVLNRAQWPNPPMKSVVAYKDEEAGWTPIDSSYTFRFSLYGRSYVETVKPGGETYDGYFGGMHRGTGAINLFDHRDPNTGKNGIGAKTLLTLRKFNVDRFGRRTEVKEEKRTWHGEVCTSPTPPG